MGGQVCVSIYLPQQSCQDTRHVAHGTCCQGPSVEGISLACAPQRVPGSGTGGGNGAFSTEAI